MSNIYLCEDSLEGIFTGIYQAMANDECYDNSKLIAGEIDNYELFANYIEVIPDLNSTKTISKLIYQKFGEEGYVDICQALASNDYQKADAVYHTIMWGKNMGNLADQYVRKVFELGRAVGFEISRMMQFARFSELENGILFSKVGPKYNVISFIAEHFSNRLPIENFVIYDSLREIFLVHPAGKECFLISGDKLQIDISEKFSEKEEHYRSLFCHFCKTIAIENRRNLNLQRQMFPLRFREYMPEKDIDFSA